MRAYFGYQLNLQATLDVHGSTVDITDCFKFDPSSATGLYIDHEEALARIEQAELRQLGRGR